MSSDYSSVEAQRQDFIDLGAIAGRIWRGRLLVGLCSALFLVLAVFYLHFATYKYTATLLLVPTQGQNQTGSGSGQLSGLASLAGIDLGGSQNVSPFTLYPEIMKARIVADNFAARYPGLMHRLFPTQWNPATRQWRDPGGSLHVFAGFVKSILGFPPRPWAAPSGADVQELIRTRVQATPDSKKPILTVTFEDKDADLARQFLTALHESTDRVLREETLDRSTKYAHYLGNQLLSVQQTDLRQVLTNSLSQQETLLMMSNSDTPFAAQPVGDSVSSQRPTSPNPAMVLLAAMIMGAILGSARAYFAPSSGDLWRRLRYRGRS